MSSANEITVVEQALEWAYDKATSGFGVLGTAENLSEEYLRNSKNDKFNAANSLITWQCTKAATAGFVTNIGGAITLPVTIPANLAAVLYIQLRMIAAIAHIGGHDIFDDKTKTLCFVCLTGNSAGEIIKEAGIQFGTKFTASAIKTQITREMLNSINKAVGFRFLTKTGTTGIVNISKLVPIVGGIIGGSFDALTTNAIGVAARNAFIEIAHQDEKSVEEPSVG